MGLFTELFAWWTGNTIGTRLFTWRHGIRVGSDELGNVYYREKNGPKRWVVYRDLSEASLVPPEWHGWLHYTVDVPPTEQSYEKRPWELPSLPNMTGILRFKCFLAAHDTMNWRTATPYDTTVVASSILSVANRRPQPRAEKCG